VTLKERITEDMKAAMRASEKERLSTIRLVQAAIKQREVDERITLDDTQVLVVLEKMVKQRKESIAQFEQGGRKDLADKERREIELLQAYLPAQLSDSELDVLIREAVASEAYRNLLKTTLAVPFPCSPEELAAFQAKETIKWGEIVRVAGMKEP